MAQTHTWNVTISEGYAIAFTASNFPSSWTLNASQNITCSVVNNGTSGVWLLGSLYAKPLKPSAGTYSLVGNSICSATSVGAGSTYSFSFPAKFIRSNLTPNQSVGEIATQSSSAYWTNGWQFKIVVQIWTGNNCASGYQTGEDISVESASAGASVNGTIADIDDTTTVYNTACDTGATCNIVSIGLKNAGNQSGLLYYKIYNCSPATCTPTNPITGAVPTGANISPGIVVPALVQITAPLGSGVYTYGLKVWGANENEPVGFTLIGTEAETTSNYLIGAIAVIGLAGVLWYTKKKKMW